MTAKNGVYSRTLFQLEFRYVQLVFSYLKFFNHEARHGFYRFLFFLPEAWNNYEHPSFFDSEVSLSVTVELASQWFSAALACSVIG